MSSCKFIDGQQTKRVRIHTSNLYFKSYTRVTLRFFIPSHLRPLIIQIILYYKQHQYHNTGQRPALQVAKICMLTPQNAWQAQRNAQTIIASKTSDLSNATSPFCSCQQFCAPVLFLLKIPKQISVLLIESLMTKLERNKNKQQKYTQRSWGMFWKKKPLYLSQ